MEEKQVAPDDGKKGEPPDEPYEGMVFESEEAAKLFYTNYAICSGFRARISRYCRSRRDNSIISRQIVCSKEGFLEAQLKNELPDEGRSKRPRMITRIGCKAMIVVRKMNSGKWVVTKFEREHNHMLSPSDNVSHMPGNDISNNPDMPRECSSSTDQRMERSTTDRVVSQDDSTVYYNHLCREALKCAQEGSVSEAAYRVAVAALKGALQKVSAAKNSFNCSQALVPMEDSKFAQQLRQASSDVPQCSILGKEPETADSSVEKNALGSSSIPKEELAMTSGNSSKKPLLVSGVSQASKGETNDSRVPDLNVQSVPLLPVMGSQVKRSTSCSYTILAAAPISTKPMPSHPAQRLCPPKSSRITVFPFQNAPISAGSLLHDTAVACGARVVPPSESASLIKAIEEKIKSGEAVYVKPAHANPRPQPSPKGINRLRTMTSSSEEEGGSESFPHETATLKSLEGYCN